MNVRQIPIVSDSDNALKFPAALDLRHLVNKQKKKLFFLKRAKANSSRRTALVLLRESGLGTVMLPIHEARIKSHKG